MKNVFLHCFFIFSLVQVFAQDTVYVKLINPTAAFPIYTDANSTYIVRAKAENTDTLESITNAQISVDDIALTTFKYGEYYVAEWTPSFGIHEFSIEATSSSGATVSETVSTTLVFGTSDTTLTAFEDVLVKFGGTGRSIETTAQLPNHVGVYDSLYATMRVTCPAGDCDPWDRVAWVDVKAPDGTWVELIRYITPYGRSCSHNIDLSDYLFMLNGEVEFRVFVDTWTGSWDFALDLEYYTGFTDKKYGTVVSIYDGAYEFGDYADLTPFDSVALNFDANVNHAQFNMLLSGHGWNPAINTGNAAEFYPAVHQVYLDNDTIAQDTWNICDPNPDGCSPQAGTWYNDRSGWCPGAITHPYVYDLSTYLANDELTIYYEYDKDYIDFCHPNHPDCVSGTTCANCDEGFNPHYYLGANLFMYSAVEPFELKSKPTNIINKKQASFDFTLSPNPSNTFVALSTNYTESAIYLFYTIDGKLVHKVNSATLKNNGNKVALDGFSKGVYFVEMLVGKESSIQKLIIE